MLNNYAAFTGCIGRLLNPHTSTRLGTTCLKHLDPLKSIQPTKVQLVCTKGHAKERWAAYVQATVKGGVLRDHDDACRSTAA